LIQITQHKVKELTCTPEVTDNGTSGLGSTSRKCQTTRSAELSGAELKVFYYASIFALKIGENQDFISCTGTYFICSTTSWTQAGLFPMCMCTGCSSPGQRPFRA